MKPNCCARAEVTQILFGKNESVGETERERGTE